MSDTTDPFNTPGKGLDYTMPASRDDTDPLSPVKLAERELSCKQAILEWDRLFREAVVIESEPGYRIIKDVLVGIEQELPRLIEMAKARRDFSREIFMDMSQLDMRVLENIKARVEAGKVYQGNCEALDLLVSMQGVVRRRLYPNSVSTPSTAGLP